MNGTWSIALLGSVVAVALSSATARAQQEPGADEAEAAAMREFEASLGWKTGEVPLAGGVASLHLPASLRYLDPADTQRVLEQAWGNPSGGGTLGMLFPSDQGPFDDLGWGVVITFEQEGYVEDDDAASLDFDELLSTMKSQSAKENELRRQQKVATVQLVGWATPPRYDAASKKLYWAKELAFEGSPEHTLNYNIRMLGRRGVLVLNAVAGMSQLAQIEGEVPAILGAVEFNPGHRYADFDPGVDKVAAYGIGALIAGKVAAKAGFFKVLVAMLLAAKKLVIVVVVGLLALVRRVLWGRAPEPAPLASPPPGEPPAAPAT